MIKENNEFLSPTKIRFKNNAEKLNKIINDNKNILKIILEEIPHIKEDKRYKKTICQYCGREYISGSASGNNCSHCRIEFYCIDCKKWYELNKRYIDFNNLEESLLGLKCTYHLKIDTKKKLQGPGICTKDGCNKYSESRDIYGYCEKCHNEVINKMCESYNERRGPGKCLECNTYSEERFGIGRCKQCHDKWYQKHNSSPKMRKIQAENARKIAINNQKPGICTRCKKEVDKRNSAGICSECMSKEMLKNKNPGKCTVCSIYCEERDTVGRCLKCRNKSLENWRCSEDFKEMLANNGVTTTNNN